MFNKLTSLLLVIFAAFFLFSGCDNLTQDKDTIESNAKKKRMVSSSTPLVSVNERIISEDEFNLYKKRLINSDNFQALTDKQILDQLIDIELWKQQAIKKKLNEETVHRVQIKLNTNQYLAEQAKDFLTKTKLISEEAIRKEYADRFIEENRKQYKLLAIEANNAGTLEDAIKTIKMGSNFKHLSEGMFHSTLHYLPQDGNGWTQVASLTAQQKEALADLNIGQYTTPIQINNTWQLLFVVDKGTAPAPEYKTVKKSIMKDLQSHQIQLHVKVLRTEANISMLNDNLGLESSSADVSK